MTFRVTKVNQPRPVKRHGFVDIAQPFFRKSFRHAVTAGGTRTFDEKFAKPYYLSGGAYVTDGNVAPGDKVEFEIVDVDNVLGLGAGVVLARYVEDEFVVPNDKVDIPTETGKLVPAGVYFRTKYVSLGSTDLVLIVRLFLREGP